MVLNSKDKKILEMQRCDLLHPSPFPLPLGEG